MKHVSRVVASLLVFVPHAALSAVWVFLYLRFKDRLPEEVATHFGAGFEADGFSSPSGMFWPALAVLLGMGAMFGAMLLFSQLPVSAKKALFACAYGTLGLLGYLFIGTLLLQVDLGTARGLEIPGTQLLAALFVTAVAASIGWLLAKVGPQEPNPEPAAAGVAPRLSTLTKRQVASWSRSVAPAPVMVLATVSLLASALLLAVLQVWVAAVLTLVVALGVAACTSLRVTVDRRGVVIAVGGVPGLRRVIELERIVEARSREVSPMGEFGGWGYRIVPGKRGLVLRAGEALALELREGREFVVTVDDAQTAAALVNTLVEDG